MEQLGYINERVMNDVHTWKIFKANGRVYARVCIKRSRLYYQSLDALGHLNNNNVMYERGNYAEVEDGLPFEITQKDGLWGTEICGDFYKLGDGRIVDHNDYYYDHTWERRVPY